MRRNASRASLSSGMSRREGRVAGADSSGGGAAPTSFDPRARMIRWRWNSTSSLVRMTISASSRSNGSEARREGGR